MYTYWRQYLVKVPRSELLKGGIRAGGHFEISVQCNATKKIICSFSIRYLGFADSHLQFHTLKFLLWTLDFLLARYLKYWISTRSKMHFSCTFRYSFMKDAWAWGIDFLGGQKVENSSTDISSTLQHFMPHRLVYYRGSFVWKIFVCLQAYIPLCVHFILKSNKIRKLLLLLECLPSLARNSGLTSIKTDFFFFSRIPRIEAGERGERQTRFWSRATCLFRLKLMLFCCNF